MVVCGRLCERRLLLIQSSKERIKVLYLSHTQEPQQNPISAGQLRSFFRKKVEVSGNVGIGIYLPQFRYCLYH